MSRRIERAAVTLTFLLLVAGLGMLWLTGVSSVRHLAANLIGSYFILWGLVLIIAKGSRAELMPRFVLTSMALGAVFLCLEATAFIGGVDYRIVFGLSMEQARWQRPYRAFDPELGWVIKPYVRFSGTTRGHIATRLCLDGHPYPYAAVFDRHGFRNDVDLRAADIAVVGDSFVEAVETSNDRVLTSVLGRLTERTVANLGRGAYGPQQQLIVLERYALPLRPKVIVWTFYEGNDLQDLELYDKMIAALKDGKARVSPSASERSFVVSALTGLLRIIRGCTPASPDGFSSGLFRTVEGREIGMHFMMYRTLPNDRWSPEHAEALRRMRAVLEQARELTQRHDITLVVAFIPLSFRVYKDIVQCTDGPKCDEWALNDLPQRLESVVAKVSDKIRYVDLTPTFIANARMGRVLYLPDDTHWSAEGHRVAAQAIAEALTDILRR